MTSIKPITTAAQAATGAAKSAPAAAKAAKGGIDGMSAFMLGLAPAMAWSVYSFEKHHNGFLSGEQGWAIRQVPSVIASAALAAPFALSLGAKGGTAAYAGIGIGTGVVSAPVLHYGAEQLRDQLGR